MAQVTCDALRVTGERLCFLSRSRSNVNRNFVSPRFLPARESGRVTTKSHQKADDANHADDAEGENCRLYRAFGKKW